jgi:hypothetical protein
MRFLQEALEPIGAQASADTLQRWRDIDMGHVLLPLRQLRPTGAEITGDDVAVTMNAVLLAHRRLEPRSVVAPIALECLDEAATLFWITGRHARRRSRCSRWSRRSA